MAYADEQSYEEMISSLQTFISNLDEQCNAMEQAGSDCVDNTDGDPAAIGANAKMQQCIGKIRESIEEISRIISALQDELDAIREAAAKAKFDD